MNKTWSTQTEEFILNNCDKLKDRDLMIDLALRFDIIITIGALRKKRARMGLRKRSGRGITQIMSTLGLKGCNLTIKGGN